MADKTKMSSDGAPMAALNEILYEDADPATQAVYRKLMAATGSGSPALIYRHLAIYPGLLDWIWQAVEAEIAGGWPRHLIWQMTDALEPIPLPGISTDDLTPEDRQVIDDMLQSYNRMNPVNLILIGAMRRLIGGNISDTPELEPLTDISSAPPAPPDLPRPPAVASLPQDLQDLLLNLSSKIPDTGAETTPTMYRHFAIWPDFMRRVGNSLMPALNDLDAATHAFFHRTEPLIQTLAARAKSPGPMPAVPDKAALMKTLDGFLYVIPHMVVIGKALEKAIK
jgi:hypothetical protein